MGAAQKRKERAFPRHLVEVQAKLRPVGGKEWLNAQLINLSKGGTCVEVATHFFTGQMLEILIPAPPTGGKDHRIIASVIWRKDNRHGVSFVA